MTNEPKWINWPHAWCPVPAETMIFVRGNGWIDAHPTDAGGFNWAAGITAFAIDPDQPPQLGGPLEVGASYICRDGTTAKLRTGTSFDFCCDSSYGYDAKNGGQNGNPGTYNCNRNKDLIARIYLPTTDKAAAPPITPTVVGNKDYYAKPAETPEQFLARRLAKCAAVQASKPASGKPEPIALWRSFGVAIDDQFSGPVCRAARMGWQP